jgi:hypothetical protein
MNTPNDIRWLLFATVPVHGYINLATPISRGILWLLRRAARTARAGARTVAVDRPIHAADGHLGR